MGSEDDPWDDPWVECVVAAVDVAGNRAWLREHAGRFVRENANGDVVLRFRQSELRHAPPSSAA